MTYSIDLRKKALEYLEKGGTKRLAATIFGVTIRTLENWMRRKKGQNLAPKKRRSSPSKIDSNRLRQYVQEHPDAYLREIAFREEFDAVWASASLLHIAYDELPLILQKLHCSLKHTGILYATFKYGEIRREVDDRVFYDMNESSILPYLSPFFTPLEIWTTRDNRSSKAPSPSQAWLNIIASYKSSK